MFNLELTRVIDAIRKAKAKSVLVQLPDGLKPKANEIVDAIEKNTDATVYLWFGSCFGACDLPLGAQSLGIDLLVAFGHNPYHKTQKDW